MRVKSRPPPARFWADHSRVAICGQRPVPRKQLLRKEVCRDDTCLACR